MSGAVRPIGIGLRDDVRSSGRYVPPLDAKHLGEAWYVNKPTFRLNPDGLLTGTLHRRTRGQFIRVDDGLTAWRYYPPDCVLYRSVSMLRWELGARFPGQLEEKVGGMVLAVCGDRNPVPLELDSSSFESYVDAGFERAGVVLPIDRIKRLAMRQAPFETAWREKVMLKQNPFEGLDRPLEVR